MIKALAVVAVLLLVISCKTKKNLSEQLNETFSKHLLNYDSSSTLDSVHILWSVPVTRKLGAIIDDSIYNRELMRLEGQLAGAKERTDIDSIRFYLYEIHSLRTQMDSVTRAIPLQDTTHNAGHLINCAYYISKREKRTMDSVLIYIDSTNTMRYTEYMDAAISRTAKSMK
jgi:hypothetical protein